MADLSTFSKSDLYNAMAEVIIDAREVSGDDRGETIDIKVAYCVYGTHYRQEFRCYDDRKVRANVLRRLRLENDDVDGFRGWLEFEYDGMTFMLQDEDAYAHTYQAACECLVEYAQDDFEHAVRGTTYVSSYDFDRALRDTTYISSYFKFDIEAFVRDLEYGGDVDGYIASYDGAVNDIHTDCGWLKAWRID